MGVRRWIPRGLKRGLRQAVENRVLPFLLRSIHRDPLEYAHRRAGIGNYENADISGETFVIQRLLPALVRGDRPVFLDVGANVGDYSGMLSAQFPTARIEAFEPMPSTYAVLQASAAGKNIRCHDV